MMVTLHDIGVARQIGSYSDGIEVPQGARRLYTAGTPGIAADGTLLRYHRSGGDRVDPHRHTAGAGRHDGA